MIDAIEHADGAVDRPVQHRYGAHQAERGEGRVGRFSTGMEQNEALEAELEEPANAAQLFAGVSTRAPRAT